MEKGYKNLSLFFVIILGFVVWGFFRTYFGLFPSFKGIQTVQHFHGAMMLCWFAMLILQPLLIRYGKFSLHRKIGAVSYVLIPLLLLSIFMVARMGYYRDAALVSKEQNLGSLALNLPDLFVFGTIYILAMVNRKNSAYHMRYMIATSTLMLGPGIGRAFIIYGGMSFPLAITYALTITDLLVLGLIIYDLIKKNAVKPYLISFILIVGMHIIWQFQLSWWWQAFADKFVQWFF